MILNCMTVKTTNTTKAFKYVKWPAQNVLAFSTTRNHPENNPRSLTPFDGFNLGTHVGELAEHTQTNRKLLSQYLPEHAQIQWLNQVHGNEVVVVEQINHQPLTADAAITNNKNVCLAVMTADCLPILLTNNQGSEIAAIHGGWRPLVKGIINSTLAKMRSSESNIQAWLGPCIGSTAFEVGEEVKAAFVAQGKEFSQAFSPQPNNKYLADLHKIATLQLQQLGVLNIAVVADCTYSNPSRYYSYRRENITGRMASLISLL